MPINGIGPSGSERTYIVIQISDSFDYIVVGAGSSGCVVASRLVKDHGATVLLLEQGPLDDSMFIRMPAGVFRIMFGNSPFIKR